jgi:pSer/pThr/pTyr-binding forkhead associated (FHA) protein
MTDKCDDRTKVVPSESEAGADDAKTQVAPGAPGAKGREQGPIPPDDHPTRLMIRTPASSSQLSDDEKTVALQRQPTTGEQEAGRTERSAADATVTVGAAAAGDGEVTVIGTRLPGRPRLLARDLRGSVREIPLVKSEVVIGRASSCDVVLSNPEVSRQHARIVERDGERVLVVVGARRNTLMNGEPITGERVLRHGDVVELASERLVYAQAKDTPAFKGETVRRFPRTALAPLIGAVLLVGAVFVFYFFGRSTPSGPSLETRAVKPGVRLSPDLESRTARPEEGADVPGPEVIPPDSAAPRAALPEGDAAARREEERQRLVGKFLYEGDIAFLENRLTMPTEGSAFYAYNEVLKLDRENDRALSQIAAIIDKYLAWAEAARGGGDDRRSRLYVDKARYVQSRVPTAGDAPTIERRLEALAAGVGAHP